MNLNQINVVIAVINDKLSSMVAYFNVKNCKTQEDAKKIAFSIANSPLVKTAVSGEDPNWGRIIMAIGKANTNINLNKLGIKFGEIKIIENCLLLPLEIQILGINICLMQLLGIV